jgi:ADP-heptose synthase, bifunctional sugar kinase/adenylyltransferase
MNFIKKKLKENIKYKFFKKKNSPTIVKTRFVENISKNKLFGAYFLNDHENDEKEDKKIINYIQKNLTKYDLVVVSDYGHGFISQKLAKKISNSKKFLSLNTQVNAANVGYHTLKKYNNIDAMIINETELRHEMRNKNKEIFSLSKKLLEKINIKDLVVTRGKNGAILVSKYSKNKIYIPAFANKLIDKVGAGDAMLSIMSLLLKIGSSKKLALLIGSFAGAFSVQTMGNSEYIDKNKLLRYLEYSLK